MITLNLSDLQRDRERKREQIHFCDDNGWKKTGSYLLEHY